MGGGSQIAWVSKPWLLDLAQPWEKTPWWGAVNPVACTRHLSRDSSSCARRGYCQIAPLALRPELRSECGQVLRSSLATSLS